MEAFITTVDGRRVDVRPVSSDRTNQLRLMVGREFRERGEPVDVPTYTVTNVAGDTETYPHDEKTTKSPEVQAQWEAHLDTIIRLRREEYLRVSRYMFLEGLPVDVPPEWVERQQEYGFDLPEDPDELKLDYILNELLRCATDRNAAMARISSLSMLGSVSEEAIHAVEASFRRSVGGNGQEARTEASGSADEEREVELHASTE